MLKKMQHSLPKKLWYLVLISIVVKIIIATTIELGNDESYYFTYALQPDWNHFDHPPLVGIVIKFFTLNLAWVNDVSLRLGAILSSALATVYIYKITKQLSNDKAAWYAALLYQCSLYTAIISGLFILPDSPQMALWLMALWLMLQLIRNDFTSLKQWIFLGVVIGLAMLCKVHALYLWAGFGLAILINKPKQLLNWRLYISFLITALFTLPIIYWNIANNFITYKFHSERVTHTSINTDSFLQEIIGEILYQNPIVFVLIIVAIVFIIKHKNSLPTFEKRWLLCMSIPMIVLFWIVSLFNSTLPHWSGPAYIPLLIITAIYLSNKTDRLFPKTIAAALSLIGLLVLTASWAAHFAPFNIGSQSKENFGEYCPTLDISGWNNFGKQFNEIYKQDTASGMMKPTANILISKWFPACQIELYVTTKTKQQVIAWGKLEDVHKFAWLNQQRHTLKVGDDAYCIVPSNVPFDVVKAYGTYFKTIEEPQRISQVRGSEVVRYFYVYRLKNCLINQPDIFTQP